MSIGFLVGKFSSWESPLVLELRATQPGLGIARHKLGRVQGTLCGVSSGWGALLSEAACVTGP